VPNVKGGKEDLLALTALRLSGCNLSGNRRRKTNTLVLVFRLHLHSESGQLFQLRAREHWPPPPCRTRVHFRISSPPPPPSPSSINHHLLLLLPLTISSYLFRLFFGFFWFSTHLWKGRTRRVVGPPLEKSELYFC
jgi:hypothetical protein